MSSKDLFLDRNRRSSDNKYYPDQDFLMPKAMALRELGDKRGNSTARKRKAETITKKSFAVFGNILVKCNPRERRQLQKQDS